jgi:hypothetical protein
MGDGGFMRILRGPLASIVLTAALACSAQGGAERNGGGPSGTGGVNAATGGAPAFNPPGAVGGVPGTGSGSGFLDPGGDPIPGDAGACRGSSMAAEKIIVDIPVTITEREPVAVFIMQDRSSSMVGIAGNPEGWNQASGAINSFVTDPASDGLDVALAFFPTMAGTGVCDGSDCGTPVVPMGRLPQIASSLTNAMVAASPAGIILPLLTPTECALRGMINSCKAHMQSTGERCVAILVTDGAPTLCNLDVNALSQIAADGLAQGVTTYTLGMQGSDFNVLNAISQAGGSDCDVNGPNFACDVQTGQAAFLAAMNAIRGEISRTETRQEIQSTQLECDWVIPEPPEGETFDREQVNVDFGADGIATQTIGAVPSEADCALYQGGWYYDDPANPTQIHACPTTCDVIKSSIGARIDIKFGCATIPSVVW